MPDHAEAAGIAALCPLFPDAPAPDEALRLLLDPGEGPMPETLAALAGLYGYELPEQAPALSGP